MTEQEQEFSFKKLFIPLTTLKAIHWIIFIGFVVFATMLLNGFVWDDEVYILNNALSHVLSIPVAFGTNSFNEGGQYRPITVLYFSTLYTLFGNTAFFYHLLQLVLHIVCSVLLFLFFRKYISQGIALFITIVFLIHSINIESVSFIASTDSQLFLLFGLVALFLVTKKTTAKLDLGLIYFALLFSVLSKETGILFIPLLLIYSVLFVRKKLISLFGIGALTVITYIFIRTAIGHVGLSTRPLASITALPLSQRLLNMPAVLFYYIKTFFFPSTLATNQDWSITQLNFSNFYLPIILLGIFFAVFGVFGFFLSQHAKQQIKPYVFFVVWFLLGIVMLAQVFPLDQTVADRWFYFPMAGLMGMFGMLLQVVIHKGKDYQGVFIFGAVIIVVGLSIRTIVRNMDWKDTITLFTHDIQISDNFDTENHLGLEYIAQKEYSKALPHLLKSVSQKPYETNLQNLGTDYILLGNINEAKKYYALALQAKDYQTLSGHIHDLHTYHGYAHILVFYDDPHKAVTFLNAALKDYPDSADLWEFLALAKIKLHDRQGALAAAQKAYQLNPSSDGAYIYQHTLNNQSFIFHMDGKAFEF